MCDKVLLKWNWVFNMSKNKKTFVLGLLGSGVIFFIGTLYMMIPAYYGISEMTNIDTNNLLLSFLLVYATIFFGKYILLSEKKLKESIYLTIVSATTGIINVLLNLFLESSMSLSVSLIIFTTAVIAVKLFTIDYYHDRNDAYYYLEAMFAIVLAVVGVLVSFNLFNDTVLQTMMLGFYIIFIATLESINNSLKCMLKSKRFLKKIKLK